MKGHVRKHGTGWQYTIELGTDPLTGHRKQKSKGGFKTEREAEKAMVSLINEVNNGDYNVSIAINESMLLKDYLEKWLNAVKNNVRDKTYDTYCDLVKWYLLPKLGSIALKDLKAYEIQEHYTYMQDNEKGLGLSGTTACHVHNILNSSLKQAVDWELLYKNPCDKVQRPKRSEKEITVLDVEEVSRLFKALEGGSLYIPTVVAVTTGMRRSEILGLKWQDIDMINKIIYVKNQLVRGPNSFKLEKLKTDSSKRNILLLDFTIKVLQNEYEKQEINKSELRELYNDESYLCCMGDGRPYDPEYISRHFLRKMTTLTTRLDIPKVTFHELRHTHATLLLLSNVNPKVVSERLGHSKVFMTLDKYSHVLPNMQKDAVEKLTETLHLDF